MCLELSKTAPFSWVSNLVEKIKQQQDELTRRKIATLRRKAYDYYLTLYIGDTIQSGKVDFHPDLYLSGRVLCQDADRKANFEILRIVNMGQKRINECYSILLKNTRDIAEEQKKQRIL